MKATPRVEAGRAIFNDGVPTKGVPTCASCHGSQGLGNATIPRLSGQHITYLVKQLRIFQYPNERPEGAAMEAVAHNLSPDSMEIVAAFIQAMPNR